MRKILFILVTSLLCTFSLLAEKDNNKKQIVKQQKNCADNVKNELLSSFLTSKEDISQIEILNRICRSRNAKDTGLFDDDKIPKIKQFRQIKDFLCKKSNRHSSYVKAQRRLKDWLDDEQRKSIKSCVNVQKKGLDLESKVTGSSQNFLLLNASIKKLKKKKKKKIDIQGIEVTPPESFQCSGPLADGLKDWDFSNKNLFAACNRDKYLSDEGANIKLITSAGNIDFKFAPYDPYAEIDFSGITYNPDLEEEPMPEIRGCEVQSLENRVMICYNSNALALCNHKIVEGALVNCVVNYSREVIVGDSGTLIDANNENGFKEINGHFYAGAFQGDRETGYVNGSINYSINFDTPQAERRPANQCNPNCPICDESDVCNRDCVLGNHILEFADFLGPVFVRGIPDPPCDSAIDGEIELDDIWKYKVYNECELKDAWGGSIEMTYKARASKWYWLNDMRTTHIRTRNGRKVTDTWRYINQGERFRKYIDLEIPIEIYCVGAS